MKDKVSSKIKKRNRYVLMPESDIDIKTCEYF